ncbi:MAG: ParB/RepB/Spo0J family partition protein [Phycisphaerales bacterium]|nr:ParB/RepB/Spo0J family partition protein [Phycisphaerales bacterium]
MVDSSAGARNRKRLGRGLASLMSQPISVTADHRPAVEPPDPVQVAAPTGPPAETAPAESDSGLRSIAVGEIQPNRYQPRKQIDPARLESLAASIRQSGVMQPVLVRPRKGGGYELIAGERRWRAAQLVGLQVLPALVRNLPDSQAAEWAIVENLQREDLDPIERAESFQSLVTEFGLTHSQIAERIGLDRSSVANTIRLNNLDDDTKADVRSGRLSQGHAKALLAIGDSQRRRALALRVLRQGWTVRRLEREVESLAAAQAGSPRASAKSSKAAHITELEERLSKALALPARIASRSRTSGQVIFTFRTLEEFEAFLARAERRG